MRLVEFCPFYPPHVGGLETHAAEFNQAIKEKVDEILVFTSRLPAQASAATRDGNVLIVRFPAVVVFGNYVVPRFWTAEFWRQYRRLKATTTTIVVSRTRFFLTSLMAWWFSWRTRRPWVHIEHGSDFIQANSPLASAVSRLYDETIGRFVLTQADAVVAISDAVAQFVRRFRAGEVPVIYRGVDIEMVTKTKADRLIRQQYGDGPIIVYVGRLIEGKGVLDLCAAMKSLPRSATCLIVGDGPQRAAIEHYITRSKLQARVRLLGEVPQSQAIAIMKAADIFVNPSYTEGLPSAVIEAALCRLAIVATDVGGTGEILRDGEGGLFAAARDVSSLRSQILKLVSDRPLRQRLGQQAQTGVRQRFSWPKSVEGYSKLFRRLVVAREKSA